MYLSRYSKPRYVQIETFEGRTAVEAEIDALQALIDRVSPGGAARRALQSV